MHDDLDLCQGSVYSVYSFVKLLSIFCVPLSISGLSFVLFCQSTVLSIGTILKCMSMAIFVELGEVFHTGLDELAHGAQKEEPVLEHLLCHLRQLSPVQRDMAVHMLHLAFRAAQELGPEE